MARVSLNKRLKERRQQQLLDRLFMAFSSLGNWQEAEAFLVEFLTKEELMMLAKRLELYKQAEDGQPYRRMMEEICVASQTIADAKKKMKRADAYFLRVLRKFVSLDKRLR